MASFESTISKGTEPKPYKMKQLVIAIQEFNQTKREETAITINMHLQSLSLTIDLSIFDPHNNIVSQFFVCLYELMGKMEHRSPFTWNCVDVLSNACRNPSARHALIHTYQFIPSLSRLLGDQLSIDKKIRLLKLMQDLTCGIKISWQIPHLPHLMKTLASWIESPNEEVVSLSLAILVNLCYKNLPAIHTLMGNINVKKILQISSSIQRKSVEIHTCKLLIILDFMNGDIPKTVLQKLVKVTFDSICEAFRIRDYMFLRQIVEFILDVGKQNSLDFFNDDDSYQRRMKNLLDCVTENNHTMEAGDTGSDTRDPECMAIVLKFLNFLIETGLADDITTYPTIMDLALKYIQTDQVSSQALAVLKSVAVKVGPSQNEVLEPLVHGLPIFLMVLNRARNETTPVYVERHKNISGLLQLLKAMVQVTTIRQNIVKDLTVEMLRLIFEPLLSESISGGFRAHESDAGNIDNINLYVHGVALVRELAKHDPSWLNLQLNLLKHKQIYMVLAQSLFESSAEVKTIVLDMLENPDFSRKMIAEAMSTIQPLVASSEPGKSNSASTLDNVNFPVLSVTQLQRIDEVLVKIERVFAEKQETSILTSDVIELYEYKLAAMGNAERAVMSSLEAASERCTYLQHRNAQLTTELNRLYQLLYKVQQCYEQTTNLKDKLQQSVDSLKVQVERDTGKLKAFKSQTESLKRQLSEAKEKLESITKKYDELSESKSQLDEQHAKAKQVMAKLEKNCSRLENNVQKKEDAIKKCNNMIDVLKEKKTQLEENLAQRDAYLQQKLSELKDVTLELENKKVILETITKYALTSQQQHLVSEQ